MGKEFETFILIKSRLVWMFRLTARSPPYCRQYYSTGETRRLLFAGLGAPAYCRCLAEMFVEKMMMMPSLRSWSSLFTESRMVQVNLRQYRADTELVLANKSPEFLPQTFRPLSPLY